MHNLLENDVRNFQHFVIFCSFCIYVVAPISVIGRLLLQARRPVTRCQTISVIDRLAKTLLGNY